MKKISHSFLCLIYIGFVGFVMGSCVIAAETPQHSFHLAVKASRGEIVQLEPVGMAIVLTNRGQAQADVVGDINGPIFGFEIARNEETYQRASVFVGGGDGQAWRRSLNPSESIKERQRLHFLVVGGKLVFLFDRLGKYRIRGYCYNSAIGGEHPYIWADPITIEVKSAPESEKEALKLWTDASMGRAIQTGGKNTIAIKLATELVTKYPKSIYASYARDYLDLIEKSEKSVKPLEP